MYGLLKKCGVNTVPTLVYVDNGNITTVSTNNDELINKILDKLS